MVCKDKGKVLQRFTKKKILLQRARVQGLARSKVVQRCVMINNIYLNIWHITQACLSVMFVVKK